MFRPRTIIQQSKTNVTPLQQSAIFSWFFFAPRSNFALICKLHYTQNGAGRRSKRVFNIISQNVDAERGMIGYVSNPLVGLLHVVETLSFGIAI